MRWQILTREADLNMITINTGLIQDIEMNDRVRRS